MFKIKKITDLNDGTIAKIDYFITFCSFEDRCLSVLRAINHNLFGRVFYFINKDASEEANCNAQKMARELGEKGLRVNVDLFNPLSLTDEIIRILSEATKENAHVLVDISAFTHEALLIFIAVSLKKYENANIEYIYCNAVSYASESDKLPEKWLSRGIQEVRSVMGYAGNVDLTQETVLIMMVGYECERAWKVIDAISPEELIITYNDPSTSTSPGNTYAGENHARLLKDLAAYYENPRREVVPSNNPFAAAAKLDDILNTIESEKNIIIVPMNNKIATVGAALVALKRSNIQLCYAPAMIYNTANYTIAGDTCYVFSLNNTESMEIG